MALPTLSLQVQYMPLAEGQAFDNGLFKLFAGLVRDIKMGVSVVRLPGTSVWSRSCCNALLHGKDAACGHLSSCQSSQRPH